MENCRYQMCPQGVGERNLVKKGCQSHSKKYMKNYNEKKRTKEIFLNFFSMHIVRTYYNIKAASGKELEVV